MERIKKKGEIVYKTNQSLILLEDIGTKQLISMVFENFHYTLNRAFLIKIMGKKFNSSLEVFTLGIMSRNIIDTKKAQEILGDIEESRCIEQESTQKRLEKYLIEKFYF